MAKNDINELSNKTLASYMKHAGHDVAKREADRAKRKSDFEAAGNGLYKIDGMTSTHHNDLRNKAYSFRQEINKADRDDDLATQKKVWKRTIGIRKAENRIGGETPADREAAKAARKAALAAHLKIEQDRKDRAAARAAKKLNREESEVEKQTLLDIISEGDVESLYAALDLAVRARINEALFGEEEDLESEDAEGDESED